MHQVINSAIKRFFKELKDCYALLIKFYGCKLLLIKFNCISIDRNYCNNAISVKNPTSSYEFFD